MSDSAPDVVDLRSDTVTRPTPEMRRAMADADVGDDAYGEDPTVRRLESLAAALLGKDAALYVPSGTMANQLALRVLARPGTEVLCGERAHVYRYEHAAAAVNAGVQLHPLPDVDGTLHVDDIVGAAASQQHHLPTIAALFVENTHMPASGRPWRTDELDAVTAVAREHGLAVHCDGARLWNAAIARGVAPRDLVAGTDTTMFCLSKGLSAPVGSLLCGGRAVIDEARVQRARLGGQMRQAGVIAAAGIVALETMVERLADDHARARTLADTLAELFPGSVDPATVETNIVCAHAAALPVDLLDALAAVGVLAGTIDVDTVRFVTHHDVDDAALARAVAALRGIARAHLTGSVVAMVASGETPARALAVYAHPDDPEISAGGTLAKWAAAGSEVWVLITTRGDKGTQDPAADLDALAALRIEETAKAAALLGFAGHLHLDHPDGDLPDDQQLRGAITRVIRDVAPDVVLCPDPTAVFFGNGYYNHRDHRVTGWATLDAVAPAAGNPHYFPEHIAEGLAVHHVRQVYLSGTLEPNCWVDISDTLERKIDGLYCHASQLVDAGEWFRDFLRERAEDAGTAAGMKYAEPFRCLSLGA